MFFELDDVQRRHNPTWWVNNVTMWTTAVDSTPSWNLQRGLIVGSIVGPLQQYFTHFILHAQAMFQHYEPPIGLNQWLTFIRQTRNLQSFKKGWNSRLQLGLATGAFSVAPQIALFRHFNSGWCGNFGGFDYNLYRKVPTMLVPFIITSPLGVVVDMVARAYYADKTFPKQLQKGYKSYLDAFKRIPFEQGPYYLFKNTFPLYVKHTFGPFFSFFLYDWLIDKFSVLWRTTNMPILPIQIFTAGFTTYLSAVFTYPFAFKSREIVDIWPKKNGIDPFGGNYRKASVYMWMTETFLNYYPGFFKKYFWHVFPQWFTSIMIAEKLGIFKYWKVDIFSGAGDNSNQDSFT